MMPAAAFENGALCNGYLKLNNNNNINHDDDHSDNDAKQYDDANHHGSYCNGIIANTAIAMATANGSITIPIADRHVTVTTSHNRNLTATAFLLMFAAWLCNDFVLSCIHDRVPRSAPLRDIWFDLFPEYTPAIQLAEVFLMISFLSAFLTMFRHQHSWVVVRRVLVIASLAYFGRAISVSLIQVPVPSPKTYCSPRVNQTTWSLVASRMLRQLLTFGMDFHNNRVLCGDLVYSGHTITLTLSTLTVNYYAPKRWRRYTRLLWLNVVAAFVCILTARKHYTIDIVIAYYVTTRLFWNYHSLLETNCHLKRPHLSDTAAADDAHHHSNRRAPYSIASVVWFPLFTYFESDTPPFYVYHQGHHHHHHPLHRKLSTTTSGHS